MKAGTAQRIVAELAVDANDDSAGARLPGLMVDVQALNQKLVRRSEDIADQADRLQPRRRLRCFAARPRSVKLAVLLLHGCDLDQGVRLIEQAKDIFARHSP